MLDLQLSNPIARVAVGIRFFTHELRYGLLKVKTEPSEADVYVDKKICGVSPNEVVTKAGYHHVSATKEDMKAKKQVEVKAAKSIEIELNLSVPTSK